MSSVLTDTSGLLVSQDICDINSTAVDLLFKGDLHQLKLCLVNMFRSSSWFVCEPMSNETLTHKELKDCDKLASVTCTPRPPEGGEEFNFKPKMSNSVHGITTFNRIYSKLSSMRIKMLNRKKNSQES